MYVSAMFGPPVFLAVRGCPRSCSPAAGLGGGRKVTLRESAHSARIVARAHLRTAGRYARSGELSYRRRRISPFRAGGFWKPLIRRTDPVRPTRNNRERAPGNTPRAGNATRPETTPRGPQAHAPPPGYHATKALRRGGGSCFPRAPHPKSDATVCRGRPSIESHGRLWITLGITWGKSGASLWTSPATLWKTLCTTACRPG